MNHVKMYFSIHFSTYQKEVCAKTPTPHHRPSVSPKQNKTTTLTTQQHPVCVGINQNTTKPIDSLYGDKNKKQQTVCAGITKQQSKEQQTFCAQIQNKRKTTRHSKIQFMN